MLYQVLAEEVYYFAYLVQVVRSWWGTMERPYRLAVLVAAAEKSSLVNWWMAVAEAEILSTEPKRLGETRLEWHQKAHRQIGSPRSVRLQQAAAAVVRVALWIAA